MGKNEAAGKVDRVCRAVFVILKRVDRKASLR